VARDPQDVAEVDDRQSRCSAGARHSRVMAYALVRPTRMSRAASSTVYSAGGP
jgi:hypothetical protein